MNTGHHKFLCQVPGCLHGVVTRTIALVLDPRVAEAMG